MAYTAFDLSAAVPVPSVPSVQAQQAGPSMYNSNQVRHSRRHLPGRAAQHAYIQFMSCSACLH